MDLFAVWSLALKAECVLNRPGSPGGGGKSPTPTPVPRSLPVCPSLSTALCVLGQHLVGPLLVCVVAQRSVIYILCVCSVYLRCMYVHVHVGLLMPHTGVEAGRNNRIVFFPSTFCGFQGLSPGLQHCALSATVSHLTGPPTGRFFVCFCFFGGGGCLFETS